MASTGARRPPDLFNPAIESARERERESPRRACERQPSLQEQISAGVRDVLQHAQGANGVHCTPLHLLSLTFSSPLSALRLSL